MEVVLHVSLASSSRQRDLVCVRPVRPEVAQIRQVQIAHVCPGIHWTMVCALHAPLEPTRTSKEMKRALGVQPTPNQT